jgi:hypothetical protein
VHCSHRARETGADAGVTALDCRQQALHFVRIPDDSGGGWRSANADFVGGFLIDGRLIEVPGFGVLLMLVMCFMLALFRSAPAAGERERGEESE